MNILVAQDRFERVRHYSITFAIQIIPRANGDEYDMTLVQVLHAYQLGGGQSRRAECRQ
jgi:hypothetical protein